MDIMIFVASLVNLYYFDFHLLKNLHFTIIWSQQKWIKVKMSMIVSLMKAIDTIYVERFIFCFSMSVCFKVVLIWFNVKISGRCNKFRNFVRVQKFTHNIMNQATINHNGQSKKNVQGSIYSSKSVDRFWENCIAMNKMDYFLKNILFLLLQSILFCDEKTIRQTWMHANTIKSERIVIHENKDSDSTRFDKYETRKKTIENKKLKR